MEPGGGGGGGRPQEGPAAEEEVQRRNTDCIYFLASPLTCKKGSDCEYRHSQAARVNPRDCWYWFNGNCLNPKCSFRHPPLDGMLGAPVTARAAQPSAPQVPLSAQTPGPVPANGTAKQNVPCYYFQKGACLKGDRCTFMHAPQAAGNPVPRQMAKDSTPLDMQVQTQEKNPWAIKACTQQNLSVQQNKPVAVVEKPKANGRRLVVPSASAKPVCNDSLPHSMPARKQLLARREDPPSGAYQSQHLISNGYVLTRTENYQAQPSDDLAQNGMEAGEFVREPSPSSDVLAVNADEDSYHGYRHTTGGLVAQYERVPSRMLRQTHDSYELERPQRSSAERVMGTMLLSGRRISQRESIPANTGRPDLRHRLLKQRRLNDSRSARSPDGHDEHYRREESSLEERWHDDHSLRNQEQTPREGPMHSRLHGRIKLPAWTSVDGVGSDRGPRGRLSPPKPVDLRGKLRERLKPRPNEEIDGNTKSLRGRLNKSDGVGSSDFAGPKSLAELKGTKAIEGSQELLNKSARSSVKSGHMTSDKIVDPQDSENSLPFEGPKLVSVILKRKRGGASDNAVRSNSIQGTDREAEGIVDSGGFAGASEMQSIHPVSEGEDKFDNHEQDEVGTNDRDEAEKDGTSHPEDEDATYVAPSSGNEDAVETGDGLEHQGATGEFDYEAADDNENGYEEYEDDLDDDDDFARKVGAMFS